MTIAILTKQMFWLSTYWTAATDLRPMIIMGSGVITQTSQKCTKTKSHQACYSVPRTLECFSGWYVSRCD